MGSVRVTPAVQRSIFVSMTLRRVSTSLVAGQHSAPYIATGRTTALYIFDFKRSGIFLSQSTPVNGRYLDQAALIREFTSVIRLPSDATADPKCLKTEAYTYAVFTDPATNETHCYRTPVHLTRVDSPAFSIDGYNFSSKEYSTWTESVYNSDDLQLFFVEDPLFEYIFLAIGLMLVIASFLVVYRCTEESILVREEEEEQPDATQPDDT
ncbi:unnamed protein product [Heligmosomoides polygyrus]|uniref:Nicastrin n=1 Tax=Heligmosomoides polygyrus TaxID=6339 RepID=A0A183F7Z8_HELPZ|nr:unnamed protein product [Heligmosomoides polygyrus]